MNVVIMGTSHMGKSTCAAHLAAQDGRQVIATDKLGRHPGRPWSPVRGPVIEFFGSLSDDTIYWLLQAHYQNMRVAIAHALAEAHGTFVLEGSAVRPEHLSEWPLQGAAYVCLSAREDVLRDRIALASEQETHPESVQLAIDKFTERSVRDNRVLAHTADQMGIPVLDVSDAKSVDLMTEWMAGLPG